VTRRRLPLTDREQEVLRTLATGLTYGESAGRLGVSVNTIRVHVRSIYGKLAVRSKTAAVMEGLRRRLVPR
jgi:DNA-binding CsgD family transcriptional regulator